MREWRRISRRCWRQSSQIPRSGSLVCRFCRQRNGGESSWIGMIPRPVFAVSALSPNGSPGRSERTPDAVAVSDGRIRLSYRELARRSSAIADRLCREDVGRDEVVVLLCRTRRRLPGCNDRGAAGGRSISSPRTRRFPPARLAQIIQHSGAPLVLTGQDCATALSKALSGMPARERPQVLSLAKTNSGDARDTTPAVRPAPSSLACVIYTSGSTGVPKGAMIEQRGLLNHLLSKISDLELSASDVVAQTSPQSFRHLGLAVPRGPDGRSARPHLCRRGGAGPGAADAGDIARGGNRSADRADAAARDPRSDAQRVHRSRTESTSLADFHRGSPRSRSLS